MFFPQRSILPSDISSSNALYREVRPSDKTLLSSDTDIGSTVQPFSSMLNDCKKLKSLTAGEGEVRFDIFLFR